jgi:hypothetical protein
MYPINMKIANAYSRRANHWCDAIIAAAVKRIPAMNANRMTQDSANDARRFIGLLLLLDVWIIADRLLIGVVRLAVKGARSAFIEDP